MLSKMALGAIWGYQQYISPNKGFRCAYSVRHGGTGCSGYAKYAIRDHGLWQAIPAIRQRLRDCKAAHLEMRAACPVHSHAVSSEPLDDAERAELERRRRDDKRNSGKKKKDSRCCDGCLVCGPADCGGCGSGGARAAGNKGCDTNPCDGDIGIGGCDCASCDAGGCDCGGCSCS